MHAPFRHVALIGKYQATAARERDAVIEGIAAFLESRGCVVVLERSSAECGEDGVPRAGRWPCSRCRRSASSATWPGVGGDGTMLASAGSSPATACR